LYKNNPDIICLIKKALGGEIATGVVEFNQTGERLYFNISCSPYYEGTDSVAGVIGMAINVTDQEKERQLQAVKLKLLQQSTSVSANELLIKFLDHAEQLTDSKVGFFHFVEENQLDLSLQAWSTNTLNHMCKAEGEGLHYPISKAGVWVDCVRERAPVVHNDYESLTHKNGLPEGHAPVVRELVVPVIRGDKIKAILGVGNKSSDYNDWDVAAIQRLANSCWEIIGRKHYEEENESLTERLLLATSSAQLGVWDWHIRENIMHWDDRMFEMYGVNREGSANNFDTWTNGLHPEDKETAIEACLASLESGEPFEEEFRILHPDGTVKHVKANGLIIMGAEGKPDRMLGVNADITDQKKAEQEKIKDQQLLGQMGAISNVGGWLYDIEMGDLQWTEEHFKIFELSPDHVPNIEEAINFFTKESKPIIAEAVQKLIEDGEPFDLELELVTAKGNLIHVHSKGVADLEHRRIYGAIQDITEKKKFQQAQLHSSQLSALGEVAAGAAHEINNPINGVINYAQILLNKNDDNDPANQILERIMKEGSRISSIVQKLLHFAHKDRGEFSSVNIMDLVVEPLNLNVQLFKRDGIHIDVGIPDDLPEIYGNQMQLEQVVLNILSNARHALNKKFPEPSNEKFIVIDAISSSGGNGDNVQLRIKDHGCGIPKDHMEKIFNPFFTTKAAGVGTGLGLSVSNEILEQHNARISIESEVNQYTKVTIHFPIENR
jgi:PAS domain S-box-containing protein